MSTNESQTMGGESGAATAELPLRLEMLNAAEPAEAASHYDRSQFVTVREGQEIARLVEDPADKGPRLLRLGENVALGGDGRTVISKAVGWVAFREGVLWVQKGMQIDGDVDFSTGNISFDQDILIAGGVLDLFKVTSGGSITVGKAVEAAEIRAAHDLIVRGGIVGKEKGHCTVGRTVRAKFITNATIDAGGDVEVESEIANSTINCGGRVKLPQGVLIGGRTQATGGVSCFSIGSPAGVRTLIEAGTDPILHASLEERLNKVQEQQAKARKTREAVEPLMRNQKVLTASQKEKATELLFEASEVEEQCAKEIAALRRQHAATQERSKSEVLVSNVVHPGAVIRFAGVEATIDRDVRGPVKIAPRETDGELRVLALSTVTSSTTPLPSKAVPDKVLDLLDRLLATNQQ